MRFSIYALFLLLSASLTALDPSVQIVPTSLEEKQLGAGQYKMCFSNFPESEVQISFCQGAKGRKYQNVEKIKVLKDGTFILGTKHLRLFCLQDGGYVPGEKIKYRFKTEGKVIAEAEYIPKPFIVKSNQGSFQIEIVLDIISPTTYAFKFQNLADNELLLFNSISDDEKLTRPYLHNSKQCFMFSPGVIGKKGGEAEISFVRSNDELCFKLPWGNLIEKAGS